MSGAFVVGVVLATRRQQMHRAPDVEVDLGPARPHGSPPAVGDAVADRHRAAIDVPDDVADGRDVLRGGISRFRITFADGTTTEVEADGWRSGTNVDQVVLLHHVIDLTGSHEEVVARLDRVRAVERVE